MLSREDRNLLKNYGTTQAEEDKEKEIERAFKEDIKAGKDDITVFTGTDLAGLGNAQSINSALNASALGGGSSGLDHLDAATIDKIKLRQLKECCARTRAVGPQKGQAVRASASKAQFSTAGGAV